MKKVTPKYFDFILIGFIFIISTSLTLSIAYFIKGENDNALLFSIGTLVFSLYALIISYRFKIVWLTKDNLSFYKLYTKKCFKKIPLTSIRKINVCHTISGACAKIDYIDSDTKSNNTSFYISVKEVEKIKELIQP